MKYLEEQPKNRLLLQTGGGDHTLCPSSLCLRTYTGLISSIFVPGGNKGMLPHAQQVFV